MTNPQALLAAEQLSLWRGGQCLFEGLDFELHQGQMALVTGANGTGKTTLLRAVAGLTPPTGGRLLWNGIDVHQLPAEQRGDIAFRGHLDGLKKDFTVHENLTVHAALWGRTGTAETLLTSLKLDKAGSRRARLLSAGQRRRVGLAALRLSESRLWILDEPTTSLDAQGLLLLREWMSAHLQQGGMALVATHQSDELIGMATIAIDL